MAKRDELKDRLDELFSSPIEAEPVAQSEELEAQDLPIEALSATDDQATPESTAPVGAVEDLAPAASSSAAEASEIGEPAAETAAPAELAEQTPPSAVSSPTTESAASRQAFGGRMPQMKSTILFNRSLRFRIIVAFLVVTLITVGVVTFISDRTIRGELTQDVGQSLKSLASSKAQEVGSMLINEVNILQSFALNNVVNDAVETANATYGSDATAIQAEIDQLDQQWRAADAANNNADPLVQAHLNNPVASALTRFRASFPENVEVFVTDKQGALLGSTNRTSDYNQADEDWWQAAYKEGQGDVYIGQPEYDASSASLSVNIAVPLYAPNTQDVIGVLRTTLDIGALQKILTQAGRADLLLPSGELIRSEGSVEPAGPETLKQLQDSASANYGEFVYEDQPSVVSQAPVTAIDPVEAALIDKLGWTFIVAQDSAEALGPVNAAAQATLLAGLGTLLMAALLALGLVQLLVRPITRLTATAEKVAEGDLTVQAHVESGDEVGKLAATFNFMTTQLRETLEGLEQRVAARTRDLTLAAEVGRGVSSVRELDTLLGNAVELIRERFDLYYTQVYLTDATKHHLILRAGTGSVGRDLMQRAHQLPINGASINGTAAATKHVVIVSDTANSAMFHPNSLLPDTRSEMAVPLLVGDRVVGVLDLQSARPGALTDENLSAFEALAGQLAIAIENAALFAETEQARAEVESQAQRLTQAGWHEFLDAVNRSERMGYTFDQQALAPLSEPLPAASNPDVLDVPIVVTGEPIGRIQIERNAADDRPWTPADADLVSAVASRIANQIENLRLLAQAEQYRAEAEAAMRRLTREGWESLQTQTELAGYVYDLNEVKPVSETGNGTSTGILKQSLIVRDEPIGELAVDVKESDAEAAEIVAAVAEQLSGHIESLRLSFQMQQALATTQKQAQREQALRQITSAVRSSNDPAAIMRTAVRELGNVLGRKTVIRMVTAAHDGPALDSPEGASPISAVGGKE